MYDVLSVLQGIGIIATRRTSPYTPRRGANGALTAQSHTVYRYVRSNPGVFNTDTLTRECHVPLRRQYEILGVLRGIGLVKKIRNGLFTTTEGNLSPDAQYWKDYLDSIWHEDGRGPGSYVGRDGPSCNLNVTVTSDHRIRLCHPEKTRDPPMASADERSREGTGVDEGRPCELSTRGPAEDVPISLCGETTSGSSGPHGAIAPLALSPTYNEPTDREAASSEAVCDQGARGLDIGDLLEFLEPAEGEGRLDFGFAAFDWEEREASPYTLPDVEGLHDVSVDGFL